MLSLTRFPGESFVVPAIGLRITVVRSDPSGKTLIGFEAPPEIRIWREEIYEAADAEQRARMSRPVPVAAATTEGVSHG
jgi:sRNA-binding carbon storage regulator CsrA